MLVEKPPDECLKRRGNSDTERVRRGNERGRKKRSGGVGGWRRRSGCLELGEKGGGGQRRWMERQRERDGGREGRRSCRLERQRLRFRPEMSDESEAFWEVASIGLLRLRQSATEAGKFTMTPSVR